MAAVILITATAAGQAQSGECDGVAIPVIGVDLLKAASTDYLRTDIQGAIGKLEKFIALNEAQLTEKDELLSRDQKRCIGRLVNEHRFRLAHLHQISGQPNQAEKILRDILVAAPDHYNARLSLAQILARREEYRAALYHLHFALGGSPPETVQSDIRRTLGTVNKAPIRFFNLFAAIAPDTNINRASDNREIDLDINGTALPFVLDEDSLASSGIGGILSANARYERPITAKMLLRVDGFGSWLNFRGQQFDDLYLRSQLGVRWLYDTGSVSSQAVTARRWLAGAGFVTIAGGRIQWEHNLLSLLRYGASIEGTWLSHDIHKNRDGWQTSVSVFSTYQLSANSVANASFTWTGKTSEIKRFGYNQEAINLGYVREFPWGLIVSLGQYISLQNRKDIEPFFARKRTDIFSRSFIQVTKRDWSVWGLAPVISYGFSRNYSNIDLFSYTRHQLQLGFTKLL